MIWLMIQALVVERLEERMAALLGILVVAWILSKILSRAVQRALRVVGNVSRLLEGFLVKAVRWVVMAIGIIMALSALEVSIGPLLAIQRVAGMDVVSR